MKFGPKFDRSRAEIGHNIGQARPGSDHYWPDIRNKVCKSRPGIGQNWRGICPRMARLRHTHTHTLGRSGGRSLGRTRVRSVGPSAGRSAGPRSVHGVGAGSRCALLASGGKALTLVAVSWATSPSTRSLPGPNGFESPLFGRPTEPVWAKFGRSCAVFIQIGPGSAKFGRPRLMFGSTSRHIAPDSAKCWRTSTERCCCLSPHQPRTPKLDNVGQSAPDVGQVWTTSTWPRPTSAWLRPHPGDYAHARVRPSFDAKVICRIRAEAVETGPNLAGSPPCWPRWVEGVPNLGLAVARSVAELAGRSGGRPVARADTQSVLGGARQTSAQHLAASGANIGRIWPNLRGSNVEQLWTSPSSATSKAHGAASARQCSGHVALAPTSPSPLA